jgi:hypothetical protein
MVVTRGNLLIGTTVAGKAVPVIGFLAFRAGVKSQKANDRHHPALS